MDVRRAVRPHGRPVRLGAIVVASVGLASLAGIAAKRSQEPRPLTGTVDAIASRQPSDVVRQGPPNRRAPSSHADLPAGFSDPVTVAAGTRPIDIATGDFDDDGHVDLAVVNRPSARRAGVSVMLGDGAGGFASPKRTPLDAYPTAIEAGDVDNDGNLDLAVADLGEPPEAGAVVMLLGDGEGGFRRPTSFNAGLAPSSITSADFDTDGNLDVAVGGASVFLGDGRGGFVDVGGTSPGLDVVTVADFDGDSHPDVAGYGCGFRGCFSNVAVALGDGDGGFGDSITTLPGSALRQDIDTGDFDGDGVVDLVVTSGDLHVQLGDGTGRLGAPITLPGPSALGTYGPGGPVSTVVDDVNGDGHDDIAATGFSGELFVFLGDGAGGFAEQAVFTAGENSHGLGSVDLTSDDLPDLVALNSVGDNEGTQSSSVVVLLNDPQATPESPRSGTLPAGR